LQYRGYKIFPIYPKGETILGEKVYESLTAIADRVDMVVAFRKGSFANEVIAAVLERGDVKVFWLQEGVINDEACEIARANGIIAEQDLCVAKVYKEVFE
jgi:predicted CoA-binding protein